MTQFSKSQRIVSITIATILLSAFAAKAWAMVSGVIPVTRLESLRNVLLVQAELSLGLWLLSGYRLHLSLATSMLFFLGAASSNLHAIWVKKTSCGCFGTLEIPPHVTLALNIAVLVATAFALRKLQDANSKSLFRVGSIGWTIPVCLSLCAVAVFFQLGRIHFSSKLLSMPETVDFGEIELGTQKEITIPLKNIASREINIWGGKTNCSCAAIEGLPAVVQKDSETQIRVIVTPSNLRDINVQALFYVDSSGTDNLMTLKAKVRQSNKSQ